jgi:hypothetical protein
MKLVCDLCGTKLKNARSDKRPAYCKSRKCQLKGLSIRTRRNYKPIRVPCKNCLEPCRQTNGMFGAFCSKPECQLRKKVLIKERVKGIARTREQYIQPVGFDIMGEAIEREKYGRLVDGRFRQCPLCRWTPHCKARVMLGLPIACEAFSKAEIFTAERSPSAQFLLEQGLTY